VAALGILLFPVTLLGVYSPFGIRLMLRNPARSGIVSGTVYGVSTAGSIVGTLGTTFVLIPLIGTKAITYTLGVAGLVCGLLLIVLPLARTSRRAAAAVIAGLALIIGAAMAIPSGRAEVAAPSKTLFDESVRAAALKQSDGRIAHLETEYNDIFINKRGPYMALSTRFKGANYTESVVNLRDPVDLQATYTQTIMAGLVYPKELKRVLMIGLGAGSISTYIAHHMPEVTIDVVELDPGLINAAKRYFGLRETDAVKIFDSDGRVYINRNRDKLYDLIILDAFREVGVPFHLLTKEFYTLVKQRLTPGGAVVSNIFGGTKLYASTITTLRSVFETVDVYPEFESATERQMIAVATLSPEPTMEALQQRATELQTAHRFRYSLPRLIAKRVEKPNVPASDVLTDDFAPVNLYETIPLDKRRRK
jgi:spermidine synthase